MHDSRKPTIQIKTASPACPDIVGNWAMAQKNPNESVKYLIIQMAAYFGHVDIFDPEIISEMNSMISNRDTMKIKPFLKKEYKTAPYVDKAKAEDLPPKASEKEIKTKKRPGTRPGSEPIGNGDIFDRKFLTSLSSMLSSEEETIEELTAKKTSTKPKSKKEEISTPEKGKALESKEAKSKKVKTRIAARPGTAPNIMQ